MESSDRQLNLTHHLARVGLRLERALPLGMKGSSKKPAAHAWLCLCDRDCAVVLEGDPTRVFPLHAHPDTRYRRGPLRDALELEGLTFTISLRKGQAAQEMLGLGRLRSGVPELQRRTLPDPHPWLDAPPPLLREWLSLHLEPDEQLLACLESSTSVEIVPTLLEPSSAPYWYVLSDRHAILLAIAPTGEVRLNVLSQAPLRLHRALGRDDIQSGDLTWRTTLTNQSAYAALLEVQALEPRDRVRVFARMHRARARAGKALPAPLLALLEHLGQNPQPLDLLLLELLVPERQLEADASLTLKGWLERLKPPLEPLMLTQKDGQALVELLTDWGLDDERLRYVTFAAMSIDPSPVGARWALPLHKALAGRLVERNKELLLRIRTECALAEHELLSEVHEDAARRLEALLELLPPPQLLDLLPGSGDTDAEVPGGMRAMRVRILELLVLARGEPEVADLATLEALARLEPFSIPRMQALERSSDPSLALRAARVCRLLEPGRSEYSGEATLLEGNAIPAQAAALSTPQADPPAALPTIVAPLSRELLEARVRHPIERERTWTEAFQKLLATRTQPDQSALRDFCTRVDRTNHKELILLKDRAALALGLPAFDLYVSSGERRYGIEAFEGKPAFLMLGGAHLDPQDEAALSLSGLQFLIGVQAAHLYFGHKRVTPADVRNGLFDRTGALLGYFSLVLQVIPVRFIAAGLGKRLTYDLVRKVASVETLRRVLDVEDGRTLVTEVGPKLDRLVSAGVDRLGLLESAVSRTRAGVQRVIGPSSQAEDDTVGASYQELIDPCRVMSYTADRAGLLLCGDLGEAIRALLLSNRDYRLELSLVQRFGLARALSRRDNRGQVLHQELVLRIGALVQFYLSDDYPRLWEALYGVPLEPQLALEIQPASSHGQDVPALIPRL